MLRRQFLRGVTAVAVTLATFPTTSISAQQVIPIRKQDRPIQRRRAPEGRNGQAFVRTELFFGTAKPDGAVTEDEFNKFLDEVVTPLFPDGLTVVKAGGQFKGSDGLTIKEDSYVLVLLHPFENQKMNSKSIDFIRLEYMRQHRQESVLRVDDPFLVWVSF
ncbi:MAG TPA: DUF3574 domain-containing protein [Vicinamibacterales bacterium]|jgi:hypothetical protein|nr:DUF3574 domain-containing protein [Vicinamibacterales bacterium]